MPLTVLISNWNVLSFLKYNLKIPSSEIIHTSLQLVVYSGLPKYTQLFCVLLCFSLEVFRITILWLREIDKSFCKVTETSIMRKWKPYFIFHFSYFSSQATWNASALTPILDEVFHFRNIEHQSGCGWWFSWKRQVSR